MSSRSSIHSFRSYGPNSFMRSATASATRPSDGAFSVTVMSSNGSDEFYLPGFSDLLAEIGLRDFSNVVDSNYPVCRQRQWGRW